MSQQFLMLMVKKILNMKPEKLQEVRKRKINQLRVQNGKKDLLELRLKLNLEPQRRARKVGSILSMELMAEQILTDIDKLITNLTYE